MDIKSLILIGVLAALSVAGIVEALKPQIKRLAPNGWPRAGVRLAALCVGALWGAWMGLAAHLDMTPATLAGLSGAALSSTVIGTAKRILKHWSWR